VLRQKIDKIKRFLDDHDDKPGKGGGGPPKSNVIDNDSAKMKTSHGTLQGYDGVATVDAKHQVERMKEQIDSEDGKMQYSRRMAIVEPVFGNMTHNKKLRRFSLRGAIKVHIQWKLYCIVHNLMKIHRYGVMAGA
jgi:hypothetical protein